MHPTSVSTPKGLLASASASAFRDQTSDDPAQVVSTTNDLLEAKRPEDRIDWLPIAVSHFDSVSSQPDKLQTTWGEVAEVLQSPPEFASKSDCHLINLAVFGDRCNANGNLRTVDNTLGHWGIVADYDGRVQGGVSVDAAVARLRACSIEAIVYTTPSHAPEKPRWRVVAPFRKFRPANEYAKHVDLLNGALGGVLDTESWDVSRCYYYGRTNNDYRCERVSTELCVDDEFASLLVRPIGRPSGTSAQITQADSVSANDREALDDEDRDEQEVTEETMEDLQSALEYLAEHTDRADDRARWIETGLALASLKGSEYEERAFEVWDEFSQTVKYNPSEMDGCWAGLSADRITHASVFKWAQDAGWKNPRAVARTKATEVFSVRPPVKRAEATTAVDHAASRSDSATLQFKREDFDFDPDLFSLRTSVNHPHPATTPFPRFCSLV